MGKLIGLLGAHRDEVLRRWEKEVRGTLTSPSMPTSHVLDSVPEFLDTLIATIRDRDETDPDVVRPSLMPLAAAHGQARLRIGFDIGTVLREYDLLRRVIFDLIEETRCEVSTGELRALTAYLGAAAIEAVTAYQQRRDAEQDQLTAEHLAFLAHELRNPLTSAHMVTALLRRSPGPTERLVTMLEKSLRRTTGLLDEVLIAGRLQASVEPRLERVDLAALVEDAAAESALDAEQKGIAVGVAAGPGLTLDADPRLLRSVVTNLVRNAIKFSPPSTSVEVRARREAARFVVEVEDSCGGLPPGATERLFDPFIQTGADRSGFGLGLAIAMQAIQAHEGSLQVHDLPGKGCVFVATLPQTPSGA